MTVASSISVQRKLQSNVMHEFFCRAALGSDGVGSISGHRSAGGAAGPRSSRGVPADLIGVRGDGLRLPLLQRATQHEAGAPRHGVHAIGLLLPWYAAVVHLFVLASA